VTQLIGNRSWERRREENYSVLELAAATEGGKREGSAAGDDQGVGEAGGCMAGTGRWAVAPLTKFGSTEYTTLVSLRGPPAALSAT
jgi:hypothetical protein